MIYEERGGKFMRKRLPLVIIPLLLTIVIGGCTRSPASSTTDVPVNSPTETTTPPVSTTSPSGSTPARSPAVSNGRSIYLYAASGSGGRITYNNGPSGMMMQGQLTCAYCHGNEGRGGTVFFMMQSYDLTDITWPVLSGPDPDMEHPPYTEYTLKRAITQGLDPGGGPLDYPMPQWPMSAQDLDDLAAFIMTLK